MPTAEQPRWLEYLALDELVPAERNPKKHHEAIGASLRRFGYVEAIALDERTGRLVAGHGRMDDLIAKRDAGEDPPEGVTVDAEGRWLVPVQRGWASSSDGEADAYLIVSNTSTTAGGWDQGELDSMLADLRGMDVDLSGLALDDLPQTTTVSEHERSAPEPREPADVQQRVAPGDVWQLGPHRLMCGDSRNPEHVGSLLAGAVVNVAFTSPPYADRRTYDESSGFRPIPPDEYVEWFAPVAANVAAHLAPDGSWFVNIRAGANDGERDLYVYDLVSTHRREWAWLFVDDFCWVDTKNGVPGGWPNRFKDGWEPVFHFARGRQIKFRPLANGTLSDAVFDYSADTAVTSTGSGLLGVKATSEHEGIARPSNVVHIAAASTGGHSAAFPVGLPAWFMRAYSDVGDTIYDPFVGSGSTLLAAEQEQRIGFGMEISPGYCDVILDRWERHGGVYPVLADPAPVTQAR